MIFGLESTAELFAAMRVLDGPAEATEGSQGRGGVRGPKNRRLGTTQKKLTWLAAAAAGAAGRARTQEPSLTTPRPPHRPAHLRRHATLDGPGLPCLACCWHQQRAAPAVGSTCWRRAGWPSKGGAVWSALLVV